MPRKARRVAARQAQLSKKKKGGKAKRFSPQRQPVTPAVERREPSESPRNPSPRPQAPSPTAAKAPSIGHTVFEHPYLMSELKKIGIITGIILAILIVLAFVLG